MSDAETQANTPDDVQPTTTPRTQHLDTGTKFRDRILYAIAGLDDVPYGLAIKDELEEMYGEPVNHGRLYPNLDTLVEDGFIENSEVDRRTNRYDLTEKGHQYLLDDLAQKSLLLGYEVRSQEEGR